ncbi:unnamed protein product [Rhizoctonia solani]|uniref:DUF6534 domain-containing protein n=1 Tax=Rhizoctonia solani TaxID=456999 RepID=A0A8H3HFP6_9AGAM|nr:unnamed protein product [Rhizoctonia solani]
MLNYKLTGDLEGLRHSHWFLNIEPLMVVMISSTVQAFFTWRIVKLTGRVWLGCLIASTILVQFGGGLGGTIGGFIVKEFDRYHELTPVVIVWLVSSVVTDTVITCILTWYLITHRTGYSKTDDIISRLVRSTVQTGLIVTIWAIMNLILFVGMQSNKMYLFFQLPFCKLYTASLLSTLNARNNSKAVSTAGENSDTIMAWRVGNASAQDGRAPPFSMSHRPEGRKPNISLEPSASAVQIVNVNMTPTRGDEDYEMSEYEGRNRARLNDAEACVKSTASPRIGMEPHKVTLGSGASDDTSMHSNTLNDAK